MSKVLLWPRRAGKTTAIIEECAKHGGYIVCHCRQACKHVADQAKEMGIDIPFPLSIDELLRGEFYPEGVRLLHIDNIDLCLGTYLHMPIKTISLGSEDNIEEQGGNDVASGS